MTVPSPALNKQFEHELAPSLRSALPTAVTFTKGWVARVWVAASACMWRRPRRREASWGHSPGTAPRTVAAPSLGPQQAPPRAPCTSDALFNVVTTEKLSPALWEVLGGKMLHKMKFIISRLRAPWPKIKPHYNHRDFKGKNRKPPASPTRQAGRGSAGARGGSYRRPRPRSPASPATSAPRPAPARGFPGGGGRGRPGSPRPPLAPRQPRSGPASPQAPQLLPRRLSSLHIASLPSPTWTFFFFLIQDGAGSSAVPRVGGLSP